MILKGTKFQLKVWNYLKKIPKGKVRTYLQVANIGMSMIRKTHWDYGSSLLVHTPDGMVRDAMVSELPF